MCRELHENKINSLPANIFAGLTSLFELYGSTPRLTLDQLTFDCASELDRNDLTSLPDGLFAGLTSLSILQVWMLLYVYEVDNLTHSMGTM